MGETLELKGGILLDMEAWCFALLLEDRGFRLSTANGKAVVEPVKDLTGDEVMRLIRLKSKLAVVIDYRCPDDPCGLIEKD